MTEKLLTAARDENNLYYNIQPEKPIGNLSHNIVHDEKVWILISWLNQTPADLDPFYFQKMILKK